RNRAGFGIASLILVVFVRPILTTNGHRIDTNGNSDPSSFPSALCPVSPWQLPFVSRISRISRLTFPLRFLSYPGPEIMELDRIMAGQNHKSRPTEPSRSIYPPCSAPTGTPNDKT